MLPFGPLPWWVALEPHGRDRLMESLTKVRDRSSHWTDTTAVNAQQFATCSKGAGWIQ